jgi:hypothetical protein
MSGDVLRWVIGLALVAHGIGHVLFMPLLNGVLRLDADGRSWLASGVIGDGATGVLASVIAGVAGVAFVAAGLGVLLQAGWWRQLAIVAAVISIVVIAAMWNGIPTSSAMFALAFDVVVLVALLVAHWPASESLGS